MIVVTTPTGQIGRDVVQNLLEAGQPVRVIVRDPSKLTDAVRERVEVIAGSHGEPAAVKRAFEGAQAVFWVEPPIRTGRWRRSTSNSPGPRPRPCVCTAPFEW